MPKKPFSIAIDGPAGAGKSTMAKALARSLNAMYLDTGAMYRAFGLYMLRKNAVNNAAEVARCVEDVEVNVRFIDGAQHLFLGEEDVTQAIREPEVSMAASTVSAVPEVRERMVALQRKIAEGQNVVMDGRDIGTKVLPNATLKIYLTASAEERARRRCRELEEKGMPEPYEKVLQDMIRRDYQDTHRVASPLQPAKDSVPVDSSKLSIDETVELMKKLALEAIEKA